MRTFLTGLIVIIVLSSCQFLGGERVSGNGHVITQAKNVSPFTNVEVSGAVKVHILQNANTSVKIEADENLLQFIEVYNNGSTLVIRTRDGFNLEPSREVNAYVVSPTFKDIDVSGSCDIIGDAPINSDEALSLHTSGSGDMMMQVNAPKVSAEVSGSGTINLKGQATDFEAHVSGSGDVKCFDLNTDNTKLDLSGASDAQVTANKKLDVEVSGSGNVEYKGNPQINQSISGSGGVKKVG